MQIPSSDAGSLGMAKEPEVWISRPGIAGAGGPGTAVKNTAPNMSP